MSNLISQFIVVCSLFFVHQQLLANPIQLQGHFIFQGHVQIMGRKIIDVIDTRMSGSQERLAQVRASGATCGRVDSNTLRCQTLTNRFDPLAAVRLMQKNQGLHVYFGSHHASPRLINDAQDLREWEIYQNFQWNESSGNQYRYLELLSHRLVKIVLPGQNPLWLNLSAEGLRKFDSVTTTETRWRFYEDFGEVLLLPANR